jgi:hypothetical protein
VGAVAEGEVFGFAAAAGPDGAVFFHFYRMRGFAGSFVGAVTVGRILGLATRAKVEGLPGLGVDLVGKGLPAHGIIIQQSLEKRKRKLGLGGKWKD